MVALRRPVALLVSSLMATSALFLAGVSPASADESFDALQGVVNDCGGDDIQVGSDVNPGATPAEVQDVLTVGCNTTIDIHGQEINVARIVIQPGNKLTIKDSAYVAGSHFWATNTVDEGAAIRTTDAELVIESGSVAAYSSGDGAAIGGDGGEGGGIVTIGADADVSAATPDGNAVGLGLGGSSFGSLTVNGTLRMQQNSFDIPDSNADGAEITIGTTGRIVGVSAGAEEVGEPLTGSGQIDNHGAIALSVDGPTVLDHHYAVTFAVPTDVTTPDAVTVYAATFDSGSRDLPVPTRDGYTFTGWTLGGEPFDATTTLPGTSEDGAAVAVELTATFGSTADPVGDFQAAMADCDTATVTLTGDVSLPGDAFDIACERTIDLAGFDLAVRSLAIGASQHLTIKDSGTGGHLTASTPNEEEAAIRTTGATLTIDGGVVTASGGSASAGIGGDGSYQNNNLDSSAGTVVIDGGTVTATGGYHGAGIGTGIYGRFGGSVTVHGGTVTAMSLRYGSGIGGGYLGDGGTITIDGGVVVASSPDRAGIGGFDAKMSIGKDADVTASSVNGSAVGNGEYALSPGHFGTLRVDGRLRLPSGELVVAESRTGPEVTVGATGRIVGVTEDDPSTGAAIIGDGQVENGGSITLAPQATVTDHHYAVTFEAPQGASSVPRPKKVYAATFADGSQTLPGGPTLDGSTFVGWQLDANDDGLGDGVVFDDTSTLPGSSTDGAAVPVTLVAVYEPDRAISRPTISAAGHSPIGQFAPVVGDLLTAGEGTPTGGDGVVTYEWKTIAEDGPSVVGTGSTYTPKAADVGKPISVTKTITQGEDIRTRTSRATVAVAPGTFASPTITIDGTVQVGKTVTAVVSDTPAPEGTTITGQWFTAYFDDFDFLNNDYYYFAIPGATSPTFAVGPGQYYDFGGFTYELVYRETRTLDGYTTLVTQSPRETVAVGQFTFDDALPSPVAAVGAKLSAAVDPNAPAGSQSYRWVIDGETVSTLRSYRPTLDDFGKTISVTVTGSSNAYETRTRTSTTDPVGLGTFTDAGTEGITISGTPKVGNILTAGSGIEPSPAPSSTTGRWYRGTTPIPGATAPTYLLTAADVTGDSVGRIRYEETRKLAGYTPLVSESESVTVTAADPTGPTGPTDPGMFTTGPTATISGIVKVGEELTASTGTTSPLPDRFTYQWFAGTTAISGATGARYTPTSAQVGQRISVEVTARREGYPSVSDRSSATAAVASRNAPSLSFGTSRSSVRLGEQADLSWSSTGATSVSAGGGWGSLKGLSGSESVKPGALGVTTYTLSATNENGTTTAQVAVAATVPAERLGIDTSSSVKQGRSLRVRVKGLAPGEAYTIRVSGTVRASGTASSAGTVSRSVRVPRSTKTGSRTVSVTGSVGDRYGKTSVKVTKR